MYTWLSRASCCLKLRALSRKPKTLKPNDMNTKYYENLTHQEITYQQTKNRVSCWNKSLSTFRDASVPTHEHGRVSMVVWLACLASTESLSHFACGLDTGALNWRRPRWLGTVPCKYCMHAQQLLTQEQFTVASSRSVVREPISQHPCPAREQDRRWPLTMQFFSRPR